MEGVLPLGLTLVLVSFFILVAVARLYLLIQEMPLLVSGTLIKLGGKVKVNSRCGIDLLLGKKVGSKGVFQFDPTPVDKSVSC
jgi:hypothetical protein